MVDPDELIKEQKNAMLGTSLVAEFNLDDIDKDVSPTPMGMSRSMSLRKAFSVIDKKEGEDVKDGDTRCGADAHFVCKLCNNVLLNP